MAARAGRGRIGEQPGGLGDGERDHSRVGGRGLVRPDRAGCPGVGAAAEQGGGDGADGQGGHHQHGVPGDRVVEADLGLVEAEAALTGSEIFSIFQRVTATAISLASETGSGLQHR